MYVPCAPPTFPISGYGGAALESLQYELFPFLVSPLLYPWLYNSLSAFFFLKTCVLFLGFLCRLTLMPWKDLKPGHWCVSLGTARSEDKQVPNHFELFQCCSDWNKTNLKSVLPKHSDYSILTDLNWTRHKAKTSLIRITTNPRKDPQHHSDCS